MQPIIFALSLLLSVNFAGDFTEEPTTSGEGLVTVVDFDELQPLLCPQISEGETYVINFFATWCVPCVREMPYFQQLHEEYREAGMKLIIVSLDFPRHLESRLIPFIENNDLEAIVYLLDDTRQNYWIPKVDEEWTGAIPATIVCNGSERKFFEREFHNVDELREVVDPFMHKP